MDDVVYAIASLIERGGFSYTVTPNVDHIMKLQKDPSFRNVYERADLVVPDGVPLLWASKILKTPLSGRVNGTDLFGRLSELAGQKGYSIYLLGGAEGTAEATTAILRNRIPNLNVGGYSCPPVGFEKNPETNAAVVGAVAAARPDILFVGLGAPKQEEWIARYGPETGASHAVGIGASFSFVSGQIRRAPKVMQRTGLEWLWRLLSEPRRLWRRYLIEDFPFLWKVAVESREKRLSEKIEPE
jgi:N-acetylglucosaminyldiphosphoundecaprenol N-acetyl-beta-D-mannosaminyltransferase